jgi:hypothetical protein
VARLAVGRNINRHRLGEKVGGREGKGKGKEGDTPPSPGLGRLLTWPVFSASVEGLSSFLYTLLYPL